METFVIKYDETSSCILEISVSPGKLETTRGEPCRNLVVKLDNRSDLLITQSVE
jgi:hypothetical protein